MAGQKRANIRECLNQLFGNGKQMNNFSKISIAVISCMLSSLAARAQQAKDYSHFDKPTTSQQVQIDSGKVASSNACKWNMENFNPNIFPLHRLETKAENYDSDKLANLAIKNDVGTILIYPTEGAATFKELTSTSVTKLFGEPSFQGQSEREPSLGLLIFHLKALGPSNEPNIFHLEIETTKDGQIKNYRVRGYGIKNAEWLSV